MRTDETAVPFFDRIVIVTGAASGIGQDLCRMLARDGARLGLVDRDEIRLEAFAAELRQAGVTCAAVAADVRRRDDVQSAVAQITNTLGAADVLVASAGICRASTVHDLAIADVEELMEVNFLGLVYMIEAVLPSMLERKSGHIVGISSMAGVRGIPFEPAYCASKAAIAAYLESLRSELSPLNIAVTTVFPGYVQTPLLDEINGMMGADMSNGRAFSSEAAAAAILKAVERRRPHLYFPRGMGLSVRFSRLVPPRMYDRAMRLLFGHFPISRRGAAAERPARERPVRRS